MENRKLIIVLGALAGLVGLSFMGRYAIFGNSQLVSLKSDSVVSSIETSFKSSDQNSYLPIEGKDYFIDSVTYFDKGQWAVVSIKPIGTSMDPARILLSKGGDSYAAVLGPGNFFTADELKQVPKDVANALNYRTGN